MCSDIPDDWPNAQSSQIRRGPVHEWHFQRGGSGPKILLLHGAGGSVHSFRDFFPLLTAQADVLAPDLPGHGFTRSGAQNRSGLVAMAQDIQALCEVLEFKPEHIIGHSAGAAIALQMGRTMPDVRIAGINSALGHFEGLAGFVFPAMAKLLSVLPFTARLFSATSANRTRIRSLIDSTGSQIDDAGIDLYQRLVSRESHVNGALAMMAQWSLNDLLSALPDIENRCVLFAGLNDKTVPSSVSETALQALPDATLHQLEGLGHLMHEEAPELMADLILKAVAA